MGGYTLGALDGIDGTSVHFPAQVCAVLPCAKPSRECLSYQSARGSLQGVSIEMTGNISSSLLPEVLATRGGDSQVLLTPGAAENGFSFERSPSTSSLNATTSLNLFSVLLYGRRFDEDSLP